MKKNYKKKLADLREELTVIYSALHKAEDKVEELTNLTDVLNTGLCEKIHQCESLRDKLTEVRSVLHTLSERHVGFTINGWTLLICVMPRSLVDWIKKFRLSGMPASSWPIPGSALLNMKTPNRVYDPSFPTRAPSAYLEEGTAGLVAEDV
jgi:hypothetical protein